MSESALGQVYADQYDLLYADKDYEAECDLLVQVFQRYGNGPIRTILDLGCGTGNHAFPLAKRGYQVTGVDRSVDMLAQAERKANETPVVAGYHHPAFHQGDVRKLDWGQQFDAVLVMFTVLGYQLTNDHVLSVFERSA
ncbi:class I SAM-dependent DNA methyltransferase [Chloroflexota bacterium]